MNRNNSATLNGDTLQISHQGVIYSIPLTSILFVKDRKRTGDLTPGGRARWRDLTIYLHSGVELTFVRVSEGFTNNVRKAVRRIPPD